MILFLLFNFAFMCRCFFDKSSMSHRYFLREIAKISIPQVKWHSCCFKGDIVFKLKFCMCFCSHVCAWIVCVHTCALTHVFMYMCVWVHEFSYIHNMIDFLVLLRTSTQETAYLCLNLSPATFWLCKFKQVFLISCFSVLILSSCKI